MLDNPEVQVYSLFDLLQTEDAQMAVVGLTTRVDAADLLEKRVRSRFSQRLLLVPPLVTTDDCAALIRHTLALPAKLAKSVFMSPMTTPMLEPSSSMRRRAAPCMLS